MRIFAWPEWGKSANRCWLSRNGNSRIIAAFPQAHKHPERLHFCQYLNKELSTTQSTYVWVWGYLQRLLIVKLLNIISPSLPLLVHKLLQKQPPSVKEAGAPLSSSLWGKKGVIIDTCKWFEKRLSTPIEKVVWWIRKCQTFWKVNGRP